MNITPKESDSTEALINPSQLPHKSALVVNADDWGRNREVTDKTFDCVRAKTISSVSAMVFMEDSERGAELALSNDVDAGLHINLTTPFSATVSAEMRQHHERVFGYLRKNRLAQAFFNPGLHRSFQYVVAAQLDEFRRIYGRDPDRVDGHHHMHLCANVLLGRLLPKGTIARRNFSFRAGEKSFLNRAYRSSMDSLLATRHRLTDYFFSLPPLEPPARLAQIFGLAGHAIVEVETHPINEGEYRFLYGGEIFARTKAVPVASRFVAHENKQ